MSFVPVESSILLPFSFPSSAQIGSTPEKSSIPTRSGSALKISALTEKSVSVFPQLVARISTSLVPEAYLTPFSRFLHGSSARPGSKRFSTVVWNLISSLVESKFWNPEGLVSSVLMK